MVESIIPNGWAKVKFSDYIIFQEGPGLMSFLFKETGFPFVNIRCIENGSINKETCQFISGDIANSVYKHFQLEEDDLIVSTSGTLGKKAFVKKTDLPLLLNTSIIRFKPKNTDNISLYFLNYLLEDYSFLYDLYSQSTGSAQVNVGPSHLKKLFIKIPKSITEQQSIANILTKTDQAIANTEALIAKYTHIKTGLMQDLLTKGIDENGNIRTEQTHEFKDSPLGRIPKEWGVVSLKQIGTKNGPYLKTGPFGSSLKGEHWKETGVPVITIGSLGEGIFLKKNLLYVSNDKAFELLSYQLIEGDILFSRVAEIGRSLVIKTENAGWIMSSNFMRLRLDSSTYLPDFLNIVIKYSQSFQKQVSENVNESGRSVTNSKILNSFLFPKVSIKEQNTILEKMKSLNKSIKLFETELSKLQSLKTGLMQDLLSGKVRVNNLMKEKQN